MKQTNLKMKLKRACVFFILTCTGISLMAQQRAPKTQVSGVFPHLAMTAYHSPRSEAGTGAMMPWAGRLWVITYVAHKTRSGRGTGLYEIDANMNLTRRPESVTGTYANRLIHGPSNQLIIGPHIIDTLGNVRTIKSLIDHRLCATMEHLTDPKNKVYFLAMEGDFFEADVHTLKTTRLFNQIGRAHV